MTGKTEPTSMTEALETCVAVCGGAKAVAVLLWGDKPVESARKHLLDCLNDDRPQHFTIDAMIFIMRMARDRGCHDGMEYLSKALGYTTPVPVQAHDEIAELQRKFIEAQRAMSGLVAQMQAASERMSSGQPLRAVG